MGSSGAESPAQVVEAPPSTRSREWSLTRMPCERTGRAVGAAAAGLERAQAQARVAQLGQQRGAGRAGADDAQVVVGQRVGHGLAEVDDHAARAGGRITAGS